LADQDLGRSLAAVDPNVQANRRRGEPAVIASGGAGSADHVAAAFTQARVSAAIISSLLFSPRMERTVPVGDIKTELAKAAGAR
jgi:imidazole glycerol phosphate synthase subunit HisF